MKVELLYFDGCPSHEKAVESLKDVLEETGIEAEIERINVVDDDMAVEQKFFGSPSIRINGVDVDPVARESTAYSRKCRIYNTDEGILGWPTKRMIRSAIEEAS